MGSIGITHRVCRFTLAALIAAATSACAEGATGDSIDTRGLRALLDGASTAPDATEPQGEEQDGRWLPPTEEPVEPEAAEPEAVLTQQAIAPVQAPEPEAEEATEAPEAEELDEVETTDEPADDGSSASRTEVEARVATQSFTAGDPLDFSTHTEIVPTGLMESAEGADAPYFGYPVLVQGDRMLVGAWADGEQAPEQGAVFVFERDMNGDWIQDIKLMASDADVEPLGETYGACFGYTMAMDGDTLAIGAAWDDGDLGELEAGAVYVYDLVSGSWNETRLRSPNQAEYEYFGDEVAVSGDWLFVHGYDTNGQVVYVYNRNGGNWTYSETLGSPQGVEQLDFGMQIAAGGTTLFVQARRAPGGNTSWQSTEYSVYVYELDGGSWTQTQQLFASNHTLGNGFGQLAFDGDTLIVGAPYFTDSATYQGAAYVFEYVTDSWQEVAALGEATPGARRYFGYSVAVDGDSFAVATARADNSDAVYVYERLVAAGPWSFNQSITVGQVVTAPHRDTPSVALFGGQLFLGLPSAVDATDGAIGEVYALTAAN